MEIPRAVVRRVDEINQICLFHWPDVYFFRYQLLPGPYEPVGHLDGCQVLGLEVRGNFIQVWQSLPTGLHRTGA